MKAMIEAGAAGVHWEDQLSSAKKCGHMGGKVLIPTQQHITTLTAARLAADVAGVPTVVLARTDALAANLITTDVDERDQEFLTGERSAEGFYYTEPGMATPIKRALAYAPYSDLIWCETGTPDLDAGPSVRRSRQGRVPRPVAGLQLLALVQLEGAPRRLAPSPSSRRSSVPWAYRVPVHHPGRLARPQRLGVRDLARGYTASTT